jgi:hypothetical protein
MTSYANESGLLLEWEHKVAGVKIGTKKLQTPITDIAGEDLQMLDMKYVKNVGPLGNAVFSQEQRTLDYIKDSDIFMIALAADRVRGLVRRGGQIATESDGKLSRDPDVNLVRMLSQIIDYRDRKRKPIKGIAVILHKLDAVRKNVEDLGLNIFNEESQEDLNRFVDVFFPSVSQCIKSCRLASKNLIVKYFPSYVELDYNEDGSCKKWGDGTPIIRQKDSLLFEDLRKPSYPEKTYINLLEFQHGFAM